MRTAKDSHGQTCPYPPFGIPRLSLSTDVFYPLQKPIECPRESTVVYRFCCQGDRKNARCKRVSEGLHTKKKEPQSLLAAALSIFAYDSRVSGQPRYIHV